MDASLCYYSLEDDIHDNFFFNFLFYCFQLFYVHWHMQYKGEFFVTKFRMLTYFSIIKKKRKATCYKALIKIDCEII